MKKLFGVILTLVLIATTVTPVFAQKGKRNKCVDRNYGNYSRYEDRNRGYRNRRYRDNRSWWDKHRDKTTVAIGAGAGAAIGGITGGKKGAVIGALLGAGGAALYTYKLRDRNKNKRYNRRR